MDHLEIVNDIMTDLGNSQIPETYLCIAMLCLQEASEKGDQYAVEHINAALQELFAAFEVETIEEALTTKLSQ